MQDSASEESHPARPLQSSPAFPEMRSSAVGERKCADLLFRIGERHGETHRLPVNAASVACRMTIRLLIYSHRPRRFVDVRAGHVEFAVGVERDSLTDVAVSASVVDLRAALGHLHPDLVSTPSARLDTALRFNGRAIHILIPARSALPEQSEQHWKDDNGAHAALMKHTLTDSNLQRPATERMRIR